MPKQDPFYVGVPSATSLRRDLLLSSKDVLTSLKRHEVLKEIRRAKIEAFFDLRTTMEEIMVLNRKLRGALPKTSIKPELKRPQVKMPERKAPSQHQLDRIEVKQQNQLELLQEAMSRVERQLKDLDR